MPRFAAANTYSPSFKINFYHIMSCAIRGSWFSLLWPTYPFKYSSRSPYIIIPSKTSYIVMLFLPYFDSFCKYKFIFHRRFLYYHRFSPFFFVFYAFNMRDFMEKEKGATLHTEQKPQVSLRRVCGYHPPLTSPETPAAPPGLPSVQSLSCILNMYQ